MTRKVFVTGVWLAALLITVRAEAYVDLAVEEFPLESTEQFLNQPAPSPSLDTTSRTAASRATRSSASSSYARLARAPNMFGDSIGNIGELAVQSRNSSFLTDLPLGGGRNLKATENNKAFPMDRVYFVYNGFQNAVTSATGPNPGALVPSDGNLNRYTFGIEKTFLDGQWSIDARMPVTDNFGLNNPAFAFDSGNFGDLALFLKHLAYASDSFSVVGGLGMGLPTGSDLIGQANGTNFTLHNDAVHLVPFAGFLMLPTDSWFFQGFLDADFAANGIPVEVGPLNTKVGTLTQQNLVHLDFSGARWLYQNDEALYVTGVAALGELHYTSAIQDADSLTFTGRSGDGAAPRFAFQNPANRTDILNLTAGLHFQIGYLSNLRVACVLPVRNGPDRQFDSEIQVSFNRFF